MTREGGRFWLTRRAVRLALLSLLLGFVTTWLLAWACALYTTPRHWLIINSGRYADAPSGPLRRAVHLGDGLTVSPGLSWGCDDLRIWVDVLEARPHPAAWQLELDIVPPWTAAYQCWKAGRPAPAAAWIVAKQNPVTETASGFTREMYIWDEACCGWPRRCLRWWEINPPDSPRELHGAWASPGWLHPRSEGTDTALPYLPMWAGLLINTFFFALLWFVGFVSPRTLSATRRHVVTKYRAWRARRSERVLCPRCGYDLRGCEDPGCPECGHGRQ
jgi:hypothetical protein